MIYSFLKYYDNEIWIDDKETLLKRNKGKTVIKNVIDENKKITVLAPQNYASILIDRQGGLFCFDSKRRKEIFRMRTVFLKSLWDVSLKDMNREFFDL